MSENNPAWHRMTGAEFPPRIIIRILFRTRAERCMVSFEHRCMSSAVQSSVPVRNPMQRAASACIHVSAHRTARHDVLQDRKPISQPDRCMKMSFRIFPHSPVLSVTHSLSAHSCNFEQSSLLKCRSMSGPIAPRGMTFCKAGSHSVSRIDL